MNLYNVGFACGLVAFILVPLMGSMGATPATRYHWATGYDLTFGIALGLLCVACCLAGLFCTKHPLWATWRVTAAFSRTAAGRQAISSGCSAPALCCSTQGSTA